MRGVTPALLFGQDANRNGLIDANESANATSAASAGASNVPGAERGWAPYLTLYSQERLLNSRGEPRINLNSDDLETLYNSLLQVFPEDWAKFIIAYRQNGPYTAPKPGSGGNRAAERPTRPVGQSGPVASPLPRAPAVPDSPVPAASRVAGGAWAAETGPAINPAAEPEFLAIAFGTGGSSSTQASGGGPSTGTLDLTKPGRSN